MEPTEMTSHLTAPTPNGYNWLLVGCMFLLWGVVSGLLPALLKWLWWYVFIPKAIYRHKVVKYVKLYRHETKKTNYWQQKYLHALKDADYLEDEAIPYEELSDLDKWRRDAKEALRPQYTQQERDEMRGAEMPSETIEL